MESYQITGWGQPLERRAYPDPEPRGSEVVLKVEACGVCHSDLHIWHGYYDLGEGERIRMADRGMALPFTMGHEVAGQVIALGPAAADQGIAVGERVVVYPWIGCGVCEACRRGEELLCLKPRIIGTWVDGGYSDRVVVPHPRYLVPFGDLPVELACTYACSGITALSALKKTGAERPDDVVLLIGAGGVGLNAMHLAGQMLPGPVVVADVAADKRAAAQAAGAALIVDNGNAAEAVAAVRAFSPGGVAAAVDFVGRPQTARFGLDCLRKGGTFVGVGLHGDRLALPLPWLPLRMLTLKGSFVGTLDDLKTVIGLARAGKVPRLPVERRPLAAANDALLDLAAGRVLGRVGARTVTEAVRDLGTLRARVAGWRREGLRVALVPTMGALHAGHLALVGQALERADRAVVSIFVNPTQFGPAEDLDRYPRDEAGDLRLLGEAGAHLAWMPDVATMYPPGGRSWVTVEGVAEGLEAASRPHFFRGVATVVTKLLSQVQADVAVFGEKDYQQLLVVRRLVLDLAIPTAIAAAATVREPDGLAMSSRNKYLSAAERRAAPGLHRALTAAAGRLAAGDAAAPALAEAAERLRAAGFAPVDYLALRDAADLTPLERLEGRSARLLAAAWLGGTRLIDNVAVVADSQAGSRS